MEAKLPEAKFIRVHKSYIVAVENISSYSQDTLSIQNQEIPIGRMYKQGFLKKLEH
jgi:DNA-binding LytR/AlgR family response regulator